MLLPDVYPLTGRPPGRARRSNQQKRISEDEYAARTAEREETLAFIQSVNRAARLEANAPGGTILLSRAAAEQLGGRARVTSLGNSIPLKGKSADFEVLRLDELL